MNKYKMVIKGDSESFKFKSIGEDYGLMSATLAQILCETAIISHVSKKEFVEQMKKTYDIVLKLIEEGDE